MPKIKGLFPIIHIGLLVAIGIFVLGMFTNKNKVYIVSLSISLFCIIILLYSIFGVGGWTGMGMGVYSISFF
ncbi:YesK family protein [Neobacillus sp. BF23-41]|uniref:YesK family protein n=1 Tax=Neobacillus sp. BF23-41 TaxID=3240280 RepID=UPI0034E5D64E